MVEITLLSRNGAAVDVALVSDQDADLASLRWSCRRAVYLPTGHENRYAVRTTGGTVYMMHRIILERMVGPIPSGFETDHKNRNGLDNQRHNLRAVTHMQNAQNRQGWEKGATPSHFKGVIWDKSHKGWRALIYINGKKVYCGRYKNEEDAARAYDVRAREAFGDHAALNFPIN